MSKIIQLQIEDSQDFKNEIILGVVDQIKELFLNKPKEENTNEFITREETAKLLSISLVKLWQLTKAKTFPVYKIGKKVLYKKHEVLLFMKPTS